MKLDGIFSYFQTRALTLNEIQNCEEIEHVFLSPDAETWDPYSPSYSLNEDHIMDAGREMGYPTPRGMIFFEAMEVEELISILDGNTPPNVSEISLIPDSKAPPNFGTATEPMEDGEIQVNSDDDTVVRDNREQGMFGMVNDAILSVNNKVINAVISSSAMLLEFPPSVEDKVVPDAIRSCIVSVSNALDPEMFVHKLNERTAQSKFAVAVGSMDANPQDCEMFSGKQEPTCE